MAVDRNDSVGDLSNRENRGLGRDDDRGESIDAVHAEIADGESAARKIGRAELAAPCPFGEVSPLHRDLAEFDLPALRITGATTPSSTAIATAMLISALFRTPSLVQLAFMRGCFWRTRATSANQQIGVREFHCRDRSVVDSSCLGPSFCRASFSAPASTSRTTKKCGTVVQLCVVRSAISLEMGLLLVTAAGDVAVDSAAASNVGSEDFSAGA